MMSGLFRPLLLLAACSLLLAPGFAASRVERGTLTFDNIRRPPQTSATSSMAT